MTDLITSSKNDRLKNIAKLLKSKKARTEQGLFVIEGDRIVNDLAATRPGSICEIYASEAYASQDAGFDAQWESRGIPAYVVRSSVFDEICDTVTPQGILALVRMPSYTYEDIVNKPVTGPIKLLILEDIQDPGNLGTMVRTAEAAGMSGIIMSRGTVDVFSPKVTRATMGSLFRVPFIYTDDLPSMLDRLAEDHISTYAAYLHGGSDFKTVSYSDRAGVIIGNEGNGISEETVLHAKHRVFIPMAGQIESLNAAVAGALLMYELGSSK